jgi:hypothetical protein
VLFANGRVLCFGKGLSGATGIDDTSNVGGDGFALGSQALISFADNAAPWVALSASTDLTCVVRCSGDVVCFGSNTDGRLGRGLAASVNLGDDPDEMAGITPIAFPAAKITAALPALTALRLSTGLNVPIAACLTFYNVWVMDVGEVFITSFSATPGDALVLLNGGTYTTPVLLRPHVVNRLYVTVHVGSSFTTYTLAIRRLSSVSVVVGSLHVCLLSGTRMTCWGV